MLQRAGPQTTRHDEEVISAQRLGDPVGNEAEAFVIRDFLCKGAHPPIELRYEVHGLQTRERVIHPDQVQRRHPVENNECRFHIELSIRWNIQG